MNLECVDVGRIYIIYARSAEDLNSQKVPSTYHLILAMVHKVQQQR